MNPSDLLPLLQKIRNFYYRLDWDRIIRRAENEQGSARVPASIDGDKVSDFYTTLSEVLSTFSGLQHI